MTTEDQRIAAVEAQRLADDAKAAQIRENNKLRKREQRAKERQGREQVTRQQAQKLAAEAASADAERIKRERIEFIASELEHPDTLDELSEDGTSWRKIVEEEIELYLVERFGRTPEFERMYYLLSLVGREGRLILKYFGVEPLPLPPEGWCYLLGETLQLWKPPNGPSAELWEGLTNTEFEARAVAWAKEFSKPPITSPTVQRQRLDSDELWHLSRRIVAMGEVARQEIVAKKKVYADKIRVQQHLWQAARADKTNAPKQQPPALQETPPSLIEQALRDRRDASWSE